MTGSATTTPTRPHQALETRAPVTPAERFQPAPAEQRELLPLWLPGAPGRRPGAAAQRDRRARDRRRRGADAGRGRAGRVRPRGPAVGEPVGDAAGSSGSAPHRAGQTVRFWAGVDVIHLIDRRRPGQEPALAPEHRRPGPARPAGRRRRPARRRCRRPRTARRSRSTARSTTAALVGLAGKQVLAAEILGGRPGHRPHRAADADVPGPRHARAAARPAQPAHPRAGAAAAGRAPRRPAAAARGPSRSPSSAASAPPA